MEPITVAIVHPEKASREACLRFLEPEKRIRVVAEARNSLEAIAVTTRGKPRVLLLDLDSFSANGSALLPVLRQKSPHTKVILLTRNTPKSRILEGLSHGASGFLERKALCTFLPKAVRAIDAGEAWVPRKMVAQLVDRLVGLTRISLRGPSTDTPPISPRVVSVRPAITRPTKWIENFRFES